MRVARSLLPLAVAAAPLAGQDPRFTVGAVAGYRGESALFTHAGRFPGADGSVRFDDRLAADAAPTLGARVEYRVAPAWLLYVEGSHGRADHHFDERRAFEPDAEPSEPLESVSEFTTRGSVTAVGVGVGRWFRPLPRGPRVELSAGGAIDRFELDGVRCPPPPPPSIGPAPQPCLADPRLESAYTVPSVVGGVGVRQHLGTRLELHARAAYSYGRANTERMFVDLLPELDGQEAPRSHWFGVPRLSAGVTLAL